MAMTRQSFQDFNESFQRALGQILQALAQRDFRNQVSQAREQAFGDPVQVGATPVDFNRPPQGQMALGVQDARSRTQNQIPMQQPFPTVGGGGQPEFLKFLLGAAAQNPQAKERLGLESAFMPKTQFLHDATSGVVGITQDPFGGGTQVKQFLPGQDRELMLAQQQLDTPNITQDSYKATADWIAKRRAGDVSTPRPRVETERIQGSSDIYRNEDRLRQQFFADKRVKDFLDISQKFDTMKEAYSASLASGNKVAIDQALITLFNKITDPQSVVRESEYARTPEDLSLLNRIKGKIQAMSSGGPGLTDNDRQAISSMAKRFAKVAEQKYGIARKDYEETSRRRGFDPRSVVGTDIQGIPELPFETSQTQSGGGPKPGDIDDGYRFKGGDPSDPNNWEKVQ